MSLRFHWMLPKGGETDNREISRVITTNDASLASESDMDNWVHFARQAEQTGVESLLLSFSNYEPDTIHLACALGQATERLKFIIAYRAGLMQPRTFVQQINTLSEVIGGRLAINIVAGSSLSEQRGFGDFLDHDERYARAEEFLTICHGLWQGDRDFGFDGNYYRVNAGVTQQYFSATGQGAPEIYIAGHSPNAEHLACVHGNCWLRVIDTPSRLAHLVTRVRRMGADMCMRLSLVCRPTRDEAIDAARQLKSDQGTVQQVRNHIMNSDSHVLKESMSRADQQGWLDENLWTGLVPSYGSSAVALVGTPKELAKRFLDYGKMGISQFIISGWPKLEEMKIFGEEILPLIRVAEKN